MAMKTSRPQGYRFGARGSSAEKAQFEEGEGP